MLSENDLEVHFSPPMFEFVPQDTLRTIHNLRTTHVGIPLNPPLPPRLIELMDEANRTEHLAENLAADLEHVALKRGGLRRRLMDEERKSQAEGKKSVLTRIVREQRDLDDQIAVLSAQVTIACEDAIIAKSRMRTSIPGLWQEWHSNLASACVLLQDEVRRRRDETAVAIHALRNTVVQLALLDSKYAPLEVHTRSGLTVRNLARTAREVYNDSFNTALHHFERLAFDLPERTQPAQWLDWALQDARPNEDLGSSMDAPRRA